MLPIPGIKTVCAATALALDVASLPAMAEQAVADLRAPAPAPAVN
jgi:hypothetical protein